MNPSWSQTQPRFAQKTGMMTVMANGNRRWWTISVQVSRVRPSGRHLWIKNPDFRGKWSPPLSKTRSTRDLGKRGKYQISTFS